VIKSRRDFKNPYLYERLVGMFGIGIDEKSTIFPTSVFGPTIICKRISTTRPGEAGRSSEKEEEAEPIIT
jgi:hypothetical protein